MNVETTREADRKCKDLIGEAYEAAYERFPTEGLFCGLDALWINVEDALKLDLSTTLEEDRKGWTILEEAFEEACQAATEDGHTDFASAYVNYKRLWERLCEVLEVKV